MYMDTIRRGSRGHRGDHVVFGVPRYQIEYPLIAHHREGPWLLIDGARRMGGCDNQTLERARSVTP
jgi:hypothetical protein